MNEDDGDSDNDYGFVNDPTNYDDAYEYFNDADNNYDKPMPTPTIYSLWQALRQALKRCKASD